MEIRSDTKGAIKRSRGLIIPPQMVKCNAPIMPSMVKIRSDMKGTIKRCYGFVVPPKMIKCNAASRPCLVILGPEQESAVKGSDCIGVTPYLDEISCLIKPLGCISQSFFADEALPEFHPHKPR
ncbi:hypothetical protein ASZ90_011270 [hydrocarbon metagenome]|uniref:Uncharacterized protein n=1 Tax=hydrocarbon metagenome TaxID=938273 RepID=A0A0W8FDZ6_9ZZZZ